MSAWGMERLASKRLVLAMFDQAEFDARSTYYDRLYIATSST